MFCFRFIRDHYSYIIQVFACLSILLQFLSFSIVPKREEIIRIKRELGVNEVPDERFGYHRKCYSYFTHKKTLAILKKKQGNETPELKRLSGRKRDRHGAYFIKVTNSFRK